MNPQFSEPLAKCGRTDFRQGPRAQKMEDGDRVNSQTTWLKIPLEESWVLESQDIPK